MALGMDVPSRRKRRERGVGMSPKAIETLSKFGVVILCVVLGIIVLAVFFSVCSTAAESLARRACRLSVGRN
jgi:hypothetical protein